jgi:DNA-binding NtrC family response regulator
MNNQPILLIVDDEEPIRKLLRARFERENYIVITAASAGEAEITLHKFPQTSLVISDVKMPGKDGITFTQEIKEKHPQLKVIVMTGHGEKSTAIQALRIGASDYLEKPFDMEEMTHAVKRALNESRLEKSSVPPAGDFNPKTPLNPEAWNEGENTSSYTVLKKKWSEAFEKEYLTQVLTKHHGNVTAAAREAAVDRSNFLRLLRRHHIDASAFRPLKKVA